MHGVPFLNYNPNYLIYKQLCTSYHDIKPLMLAPIYKWTNSFINEATSIINTQTIDWLVE